MGPADLRLFGQLMHGCEEFLTLLDDLELTAWPDWGTLLGLLRHRNIIPWDYDADFCMLAEDYERLCAAFEKQGGTIGKLCLRRDYYDEPQACCAVLFTDAEDLEGGIDIVAYTSEAGRLRSRMSEQLIAEYPGTYDMQSDVVYPLRQEWFLGRRISVPQKPEVRVRELFSYEWRLFPDGHKASDVTEPPFQLLPESTDTPSPGKLRVTWAIRADELAASGLHAEAVARMTFSDLVFANERRLWGKVHVGLMDDGGIHDREQAGWAVFPRER